MPDDKIEDKFVLSEFINELCETFPEHASVLKCSSDLTLEEFSKMTGKIYAENFFDILYKNDKIFSEDTNSEYIPNVNFSLLWKENITDKTRDSIWKYLQLIMFSMISKTENNDNTTFMENINNLDNVDFSNLSNKIEETINNMSGENIPDAGEINDSMRGLLDGKLGDLAKEIANESVGDFSNEADLGDLLKDPSKLMSLVQNVGNKLDSKIKKGEINENELMSEATNLLGKMNDIPGFGSIKEMMSNLGVNTNNMNMAATENKMKQNEKRNKTKDRLQKKLKKRKENNSI